jgi:hypothetical protein
MLRWDLINYLIQKNNYKRYLEIGIAISDNFSKIVIDNKHSVDPEPKCKAIYRLTSDDFFKQLGADAKYDIIFIDGMHTEEQSKKDVINSLAHLEDNGTIIMHDCNPAFEEHQSDCGIGECGGINQYRRRIIWNGSVWKTWAELRCTMKDLSMYVIDICDDCGIITRGRQELLHRPQAFDWKFFDENRKTILNVISFDEFVRMK